MTATKRLLLILNPEPPGQIRLVGDVVEITGRLEAENLDEGGTVRVEVDSRCLALLSDVQALPPGSYARNLKWSVGITASSKTLTDGVTIVTAIARADGLTQAAQISLTIT